MGLRRMPTPSEVVKLLSYIKTLKVYISDDHLVELIEDDPKGHKSVENLIKALES